MSDPKEQQREPDELELEAETIKDLEVKEQQEEEVRGGCKLTQPYCNMTGGTD